MLEYGLGAATVSIAWKIEYLNKRCYIILILSIPYRWCHSPFEVDTAGIHGIMNIPALFIIFCLTMLLIKGTKESAFVNGVIVVTKVAIVILFIMFGWSFINPVNHTPFIPPAQTYVDTQGVPHNFGGILGILGCGRCRVLCIHWLRCSFHTTAQESKNPGKDMPVGILGSLAICTILYLLFAYVLTGVGTTLEILERWAGRHPSRMPFKPICMDSDGLLSWLLLPS